MDFYYQDKKISKKKAIELLGKETLDKRIQIAKQAFIEDPFEEQSWCDGFEIRFMEV